MSAPAARPPRWWKFLLLIIAAGVVAILAALWYSTTDSFQAFVRRRVVAEVERITGGRAEIGSFHVVPFHMQVELRNITVHGKESPNDVPLAHADSLVAKLKVISFLRTEFGFYSVVLEHPVIHIAIGQDGATNVPALKLREKPSEPTSIEQLFALSIDHLSVRNGELFWADRKIPLDFAAHETALQMDYSFLRSRYESHFSVGKVDTAFEDFRPFAWMTTVDFTLNSTFADIKSLRWSSGRSALEISGGLAISAILASTVAMPRTSTWRSPRQSHAGVTCAKASPISKVPATGRSKSLLVPVYLALRDIACQNDQIALKRVSANSDYSLTDQQIKLAKLQGKIFGGNFTGDAQVDNWLHSIPLSAAARAKKGREDLPEISVARPSARKAAKPNGPGVQNGVVHLRVRDVSAAEMAVCPRCSRAPAPSFSPRRPGERRCRRVLARFSQRRGSGIRRRRQPAAASRQRRTPGHRPDSGHVSRRDRLLGIESVQIIHAGVARAGFRNSGGDLHAAFFCFDFQP